MTQKSEQSQKTPGADRFWGQFSQSTAGRTAGEGDDGQSGAETGNRPGDQAGNDDHCLEWCPICRSAELFRSTVSPELRQQADSIQHEAMGVLKAFLDAYTEKTTGQPGPGSPDAGNSPAPEPESSPEPRVTEIPLD